MESVLYFSFSAQPLALIWKGSRESLAELMMSASDP